MFPWGPEQHIFGETGKQWQLHLQAQLEAFYLPRKVIWFAMAMGVGMHFAL